MTEEELDEILKDHPGYKKLGSVSVDDIKQQKNNDINKTDKMHPVCPACRSKNIMENREDNDVCGPGYASWFVNYACTDCGVIFDKTK